MGGGLPVKQSCYCFVGLRLAFCLSCIIASVSLWACYDNARDCSEDDTGIFHDGSGMIQYFHGVGLAVYKGAC